MFFTSKIMATKFDLISRLGSLECGEFQISRIKTKLIYSK